MRFQHTLHPDTQMYIGCDTLTLYISESKLPIVSDVWSNKYFKPFSEIYHNSIIAHTWSNIYEI